MRQNPNQPKYNIVPTNDPMNRNSLFRVNGWEIIRPSDNSLVYMRPPSGANFFVPVDLILLLSEMMKTNPEFARNFVAGKGIKSDLRF